MAQNMAINYFKSGRKRFEFRIDRHEKLSTECPQYALEKDEFEIQLQDAIGALSEPQRVVFLMNRIEDVSYRDIATRLQISEKAVEKRMHNALTSLRKLIKIKF